MSDLRKIPSIEQLRQRPGIERLASRFGREAAVDALRAEAAVWRERLREGAAADRTDLAAAIEAGVGDRLAWAFASSLRRVINATGVIVHTNLGRAPLAPSALERLRQLGAGYTNLEYDLAEGVRGARDVHAEALLARVTGAEAAVVVNNCAAATLLTLAALASGREVLVSRGELVEIGGGFRVPDVMAQSGAILREVGTTNRTRASDYALAIGTRTAMLLRVHPSNFRIEGFVERASIEELVALGRRFSLPVVEDHGSGLLPLAGAMLPPLATEKTVSDLVAAGVDLVCFSGDKLLGGPQAGIIVGRTALVARIRRHPLMRALRVDKLTYAALEATLLEHAAGRAAETIPVLRMASLTAEAVGTRAGALASRAREAGWIADVVDGMSTIGGGSAPGSTLPTRLVALARKGQSADTIEARLRALDPPVIARIEDNRVVLDLRTVDSSDDDALADAIASLAT